MSTDSQCATTVCLLYPENLSFLLDPVAKCLEIKCGPNIHVVRVSPPDTNTGLQPDDVVKLQSAEIIIFDTRLFCQFCFELPQLKWLHSFWAGVDLVTRSIDYSKPPAYILTRNGSSFCRSMAHYVMMYILAHERHLEDTMQNQAAKIWKMLFYRDVNTLTLGILGVGAVGKEVAKLAKVFGMKVCGLVRTLPSPADRCPNVDEYFVTCDITRLLSACDYVCNILPATSQTDALLDGDILSHCQHKATVLVNIGRGNVIKNETVLKALDEGWLSHAILDVFEKEPLPVDSALWTHPRVTITPHVSGVGLDADEFVDSFLTNYKLYKKAEPMNYVVDWSKGY